MEEKKLTDEEKAIEELNNYRNRFYAEPQGTERAIIANSINDIFDFINRQKAEIERLTEENGYLDGCAKQFLADYQKCEIERAELQEQVDELQGKNTELQSQVDNLMGELDISDEAIVRLKKQCGKAVKDTAKEICLEIVKDMPKPIKDKWLEWFKERYGVEVE